MELENTHVRIIEIGAIKIHLYEDEGVINLMGEIVRPLVIKEIAAMLQVSERTVMRWRQGGILPPRGRQLSMVDLVRHLAPEMLNGHSGNGKTRRKGGAQ